MATSSRQLTAERNSTVEFECMTTGIQGLDDILCGGLRKPDNRFPSIVIKGPPGAGKTNLSARLASRIFEEGQSVAYFTLEQRATDIISMVQQFNWIPKDWPESVLIDGDFNKSIDVPPQCFLVSQFPMTVCQAMEQAYRSDDAEAAAEPEESCNSDVGIFEKLLQHVEQRVAQMDDCGAVIIDSLVVPPGSVEDETRDFAQRRALFHSLCDLGGNDSLVAVILENDEPLNWRNYVADVVFHLGWTKAPDHSLSRFIHVEKARFQPIFDGRHSLSIREGVGLTVTPSIDEKLRQEFSQERELSTEVVRFTCDKEVNRILERSDTDDGFCDDRIPESSSILLYGPDETRKHAILARFLQEGLLDGDGHVLLIVVGMSPVVARDMILKYLNTALAEQRFRDVEELVGRIEIVSAFEHTTGMEELVAKVARLLDGGRIRRAGVTDVAAIEPDTRELLPLKHLLQHRSVTSLFVQTTEERTNSSIRVSFDTVLSSCHLQLPNQINTTIGYRVRRVAGRSMGRSRSLELKFDAAGLRLEDNFSEYVETPQGTLHRLPLGLVLHSDLDDPENYWAKEVENIFGGHASNQPEEHPELLSFDNRSTDAIFERMEQLATNPEMGTTWVCSVNCNWIHDLAGNRTLEPLDRLISEKFRTELQEDFLPRAVERGHILHRDGEFGIPHQVDTGFYAIRKDVITDDVLAQCDFPADKKQWRWTELLRAAMLGQQNNWNQKSGLPGRQSHSGESELQFGRESGEFGVADLLEFHEGKDDLFLAFMLEVFWPFIFEGKSDAHESPEPAASLFSRHELLDAVQQFYAQLDQFGALSVKASSAPAIITRHSFVSYRRMLHANPGLENCFRIIEAPFLAFDEEDTGRQAVSIGEEWYLGVLRGSPNPRRGVWAAKALTRRATSERMFRNGVALPARRMQPAEKAKAQEFLTRYEKSVSLLRAIPDFCKVRRSLVLTLRQIFDQPARQPQEIEDIWNQQVSVFAQTTR